MNLALGVTTSAPRWQRPVHTKRAVRLLLEKHREKQKSVHFAFLPGVANAIVRSFKLKLPRDAVSDRDPDEALPRLGLSAHAIGRREPRCASPRPAHSILPLTFRAAAVLGCAALSSPPPS